MKLYHGTTAKAYEQIKIYGVLTPQLTPDSFFRGNLSTLPGITTQQVYLSRTLEMAEYYAEEQATFQHSTPIILTCNFNELNPQLCYPDDDHIIVALANALHIDEAAVTKLKVLPQKLMHDIMNEWRQQILSNTDHIAYRGIIKVELYKDKHSSSSFKSWLEKLNTM